MSDTDDRKNIFQRQTARTRNLTLLTAVVVLALLLWGLYWFFYARNFESTDDAYVGGNIVSITSRENGTILALYADNTQRVHRGQVLVKLDPTVAKIHLKAAEADLARTIRTVRANFAKVDELKAQIAAARVTLQRAQSDYRRRKDSSANGAVSAEDVSHARDAVTAAKAALKVAQASLIQADAAVQGTTIADNPDVQAAKNRLRQAAIVLGHMTLISPVSGVVAKRNVDVGQHIAPGTPLMAVVPLNDVWVDANFKEGQLADIKVGQPVSVTADMYGGSVTYRGHVEGLAPGSGSAFALLPPQNASGNWIKIVQRLAVRIALDPKQVQEHPLRLGLSTNVSVDIRAPGRPLRKTKPYVVKGDVGDSGLKLANRLIEKILAQNSGTPTP